MEEMENCPTILRADMGWIVEFYGGDNLKIVGFILSSPAALPWEEECAPGVSQNEFFHERLKSRH